MQRVSIECRCCQRRTTVTAQRARAHNRICNHCANQQRDSDAGRYIARKLADSLRRQGYAKPYPGVHFVRQVIEKCGGRSVLSGNASIRHLCVVRKDPTQPLSLENAALVTGGECYALSRQRNENNP